MFWRPICAATATASGRPTATIRHPPISTISTQLIHQQELAPVTIVAHSLGGNIAIRYTGVFPETVRRLVAIEGLGPTPKQMAARSAVPIADRMRKWVDEQRALVRPPAAALCARSRTR